MLESLLNSRVKEKVLLYVYTHGEGYAQEIRNKLSLPLRSVQLQLAKLEKGGVLFARKRDRTLVYQLNPRFAFHRELTAILEKVLILLPEGERRRDFTPRLRPRRVGKPSTPLAVGDEVIEKTAVLSTKYGELKILKPVDCVKDRLAAFYHWNDRQSLEQAVMVAKDNKISMNELKKWSEREKSLDKFKIFVEWMKKPQV